jgi:zinc D-Ala-D-Ala carboxypeptidase
MQLSENFTLDEFTQSASAKRLGISNEPTPEVIANLQLLVTNVLQPLRTALGRSIKVTSGYRSPAVNKAVGGVKTSQHSEGKAVDIVVQGMSPYDVVKFLMDMNIEFDQAIQEFGEWTHISYNKDQNREQVLTAKKIDDKTRYLSGLFK